MNTPNNHQIKIKLGLSTVLLALLFLTQSCMLQTGSIAYKEKPNELVSAQKLKDYLIENEHPSIVLKVPMSYEQGAMTDISTFLFNTIEKELMINGMVVKDRSLYDDIVRKSRYVELDEIYDLLNSDLILEVLSFDNNIEYRSSTIYDSWDDIKTFEDYVITKWGASIRFKIVMVKNMEYVGSYTFNYVPCTEANRLNDCHCAVGYKSILNKMYPKISMCGDKVNPETIKLDFDDLEWFIKESLRSLLINIKE